MTLTELIEKLQTMKSTHGDLEVLVTCSETGRDAPTEPWESERTHTPIGAKFIQVA